MLESPVIVASDDAIFHAMRDVKHAPISLETLGTLPAVLRDAAVYFDGVDNSLIFVNAAEDGLLNKFVVRTNYNLKQTGVLNFFKTAGKINPADIKSAGWEQIR
jgi:hypothetical protein